MSFRSASLVLASLLALAACSPARQGFDVVDTADMVGSDASGDAVETGRNDVPVIPITDTGPSLDSTIVYAHSNTTLYTVDPHTMPPTFMTVGMFTFPAGDTNAHTMTDLAVDATGGVVGVTQNALFHINPTTADCTLLSTLPGSHGFVGLTYVPAGVLDPGNEVLVGGATDGTYWRIDTSSGAATMLGTFRGGWLLSGDLVSIAGAATYVTVRQSSTATDSLATLDLATGNLTIIGDTGFHSLYGIGYWRSTLFGFSHSGQFITIDVHTGVGHMVSMPVPSTAGFSGAGVTTVAPVAPG